MSKQEQKSPLPRCDFGGCKISADDCYWRYPAFGHSVETYGCVECHDRYSKLHRTNNNGVFVSTLPTPTVVWEVYTYSHFRKEKLSLGCFDSKDVALEAVAFLKMQHDEPYMTEHILKSHFDPSHPFPTS